MEGVLQLVGETRAVRSSRNIAPKEQLQLFAIGHNQFADYTPLVEKLANVEVILGVEEKPANAAQFMIGTLEYAVPLDQFIDVAAEIEKQEAQLKHLEGFLAGVEKKLGNERFVANAPQAVVELERKKQSDAQEKIAALKQSIAELKK